MGRAPCCDKANVKKGPWSPEEDSKLKEYIEKYGTGGNWIALPQKAGLRRCGKSCRLRWLNYLRPNIKHGDFTDDEDRIICSLFASIGSRWSIIAAQLPGRTDNDIKNYWNTKLKKKLMAMNQQTQRSSKPLPFPSSVSSQHQSFSSSSCYTPNRSFTLPFEPFSSSFQSDHHLFNNLANNNNSSSSSLINTTPESLMMSHMYNNNNNYPVVKENLLMFGVSTEPSCSSSDGSCSQISYGAKEIKQEDNSFQGFGSSSTCYDQDNNNNNTQKFMLSNYIGHNNNNGGGSLDQWSTHERGNGYYGDDCSLDYYDLEDVKRLISSNNNNNNNNNNNFNFNIDENKTQQEKVMYYYNY